VQFTAVEAQPIILPQKPELRLDLERARALVDVPDLLRRKSEKYERNEREL